MKQFFVLLKILIVSLFCRHGKMGKNAIFNHCKTFDNKLFFDFVPFWKFFAKLLIICFGNRQQLSVSKSPNSPAIGLIEKETSHFGKQKIFGRKPLRDFLAIFCHGINTKNPRLYDAQSIADLSRFCKNTHF